MNEEVIGWFMIMWNFDELIHDDDSESYKFRLNQIEVVAEKYPEEYVAAKLKYRKWCNE